MIVQKNAVMSSREHDMNKFRPVGHRANSVAETFVAVICNQLSNIYPTFSGIVISLFGTKVMKRNYRLRITFTDCHMESLPMKAN